MHAGQAILQTVRQLWSPMPAPPGPSPRQVISLFAEGRMPLGTQFVQCGKYPFSVLSRHLVVLVWKHEPTGREWAYMLNLSPESLVKTDWRWKQFRFVADCYASLGSEAVLHAL